MLNVRTRLASLVVIAGVVGLARPVAAQTPADAMKLFASAGDIAALLAKAQAEQKPEQPVIGQRVLVLSPYHLVLERRVPGPPAMATVHETNAEFFFVLEGRGTAVTGGRLANEKRTNAQNLAGTAILDGEARPIAKGDVLFVPEGTPHWFEPSGGPLILLSMHLPRE